MGLYLFSCLTKSCASFSVAVLLFTAAIHWPMAGRAQEPTGEGGGGILQKPFGGPEDNDYWSSVIAYLVSEKNSRESLELTPQQIEELRTLSSTNGSVEEAQRLYSALKKAQGLDGHALTEDQRMALSLQRNRLLEKRFVDNVGSVLLPHQLKQLTRGGIGYIRREHGDAGLLSSGHIRKELGITDAQLGEIKAKSEEEAKRLQVKKAELKVQAEENILEALTESQRQKLNTLMAGVVISADARVSAGQDKMRSKQPNFDPDLSDYWSEVMNHFLNEKGYRRRLELTAQQEADLKKLAKVHNSEEEQWRETLLLCKAAGLETKGEVTITPEHEYLMNQANRTCNRRYIDSVSTVLLPHQMELLIRQSLAFVRDKHGVVGLLKSSYVRDELEITDKQFDEIKARVVEETRRLKEEVATLEADTRENILAVLTESQREKLKQLEEGR